MLKIVIHIIQNIYLTDTVGLANFMALIGLPITERLTASGLDYVISPHYRLELPLAMGSQSQIASDAIAGKCVCLNPSVLKPFVVFVSVL